MGKEAEEHFKGIETRPGRGRGVARYTPAGGLGPPLGDPLPHMDVPVRKSSPGNNYGKGKFLQNTINVFAKGKEMVDFQVNSAY